MKDKELSEVHKEVDKDNGDDDALYTERTLFKLCLQRLDAKKNDSQVFCTDTLLGPKVEVQTNAQYPVPYLLCKCCCI